MDNSLDTYIKELVDIAHSTSKDGDDTIASIFMLDSLWALMEHDHKFDMDQYNVLN